MERDLVKDVMSCKGRMTPRLLHGRCDRLGVNSQLLISSLRDSRARHREGGIEGPED